MYDTISRAYRPRGPAAIRAIKVQTECATASLFFLHIECVRGGSGSDADCLWTHLTHILQPRSEYGRASFPVLRSEAFPPVRLRLISSATQMRVQQKRTLLRSSAHHYSMLADFIKTKVLRASSIGRAQRYAQACTPSKPEIPEQVSKALSSLHSLSLMNKLGPYEILLDTTSSRRNHAFTTSNLTSSQHA